MIQLYRARQRPGNEYIMHERDRVGPIVQRQNRERGWLRTRANNFCRHKSRVKTRLAVWLNRVLCNLLGTDC